MTRLLVLCTAVLVSLLLGVGVVAARSKSPAKVVVTGQTCHGATPPPVATANLPSAPDPSLLAILGVLRRPQVPADIPPASRFPNPFMEGVEVAYERLLTTTAQGERFYLVPAFVVPPPIPTGCTPRLTPQQLHQQQALQQQLTLHPRFELFISQFAANGLGGGGGGAPSTAAALAAGAGLGAEFGVDAVNGRYENESGMLDGLVPDGVAAVELEYRGLAPRTLTVTNNFFLLSVHGRVTRPKTAHSPHGLPIPPTPFPPRSGPLRAIVPIEIVWRDAQGAAIKTIRQPAYCAGRHGTPLARCLKTLPRP
jgi:hypothetical protein